MPGQMFQEETNTWACIILRR